MNKRVTTMLLAIFLFASVAFGVVEQGKVTQVSNTNRSLEKALKVQQDKTKNLDVLNDELHRINEKQAQEKSKNAQSKVLNERALNSEPTIRNFFKKILTYDNDSYLSRFDDASKLSEKQPIEAFQGTGFDHKKPTQGVESRLTDFSFFFNQQLSDKETISGLADVKSSNTIAGQKHDVEMLYEVTFNFLTNKVTKIVPKTPINPQNQ